MNCASCGTSFTFSSSNTLRMQPVPSVDEYVTESQSCISPKLFDLDIIYCDKCGLVQIAKSPCPSLFYDSYIYETKSSPEMIDSFLSMIDQLRDFDILTHHSSYNVLDIGCNDFSFLKLLHIQYPHLHLYGVDPSPVSKNSLLPYISFCDSYFPDGFKFKNTKFKLIVATNSFAHIPGLNNLLFHISSLLSPDGFFVIEVSDFHALSSSNSWDNFHHHHLFYYTDFSLNSLFSRHNLSIHYIEKIPSKGGSLRLFVSHSDVNSLNKIFQYPSTLLSETFLSFSSIKHSYESWLNQCSNFFSKYQHCTLYGYGASSSTSVILSQHKGFSQLVAIFDDNFTRQGLFSPIYSIPVASITDYKLTKSDIILIFAWRYSDPIVHKIRSSIPSTSCPLIFSAIDFSQL